MWLVANTTFSKLCCCHQNTDNYHSKAIQFPLHKTFIIYHLRSRNNARMLARYSNWSCDVTKTGIGTKKIVYVVLFSKKKSLLKVFQVQKWSDYGWITKMGLLKKLWTLGLMKFHATVKLYKKTLWDSF